MPETRFSSYTSKIIFILLIAFSIQAEAQRVKADSLLSFARSFLGTKYKYAQSDPKSGFDCSGFVYYVFGHFDLKVPRASMDYQSIGREVPLDSCRAGDVIVFTGTKPGNRAPGHVGIVIAGSGGATSFIHSSSGAKHNGVIISDLSSSPNYKKRFISIVRIDGIVQ